MSIMCYSTDSTHAYRSMLSAGFKGFIAQFRVVNRSGGHFGVRHCTRDATVLVT